MTPADREREREGGQREVRGRPEGGQREARGRLEGGGEFSEASQRCHTQRIFPGRGEKVEFLISKKIQSNPIFENGQRRPTYAREKERNYSGADELHPPH